MTSFTNREGALPHILEFLPEQTAKGTTQNYWLQLASDGLGEPMCVPLMVARGVKDGPVLGLTAALHGDELNGVSVIQRLFADLEVDELLFSLCPVQIKE